MLACRLTKKSACTGAMLGVLLSLGQQASAAPDRPVVEMTDDAQQLADAGVEADKERAKKTDLLIVPIPQSSPTLGSGITLAGILFYNPNQSKDPWISGVGAMYTSNKSWGVAAFHSMALAKDRIRVLALGGYADVNVEFFGVGPNAGDRDVSIEINDKGYLALLQGQYRIAPNVYLGARYQYLDLSSSVRRDNPRFPEIEIPVREFDSKLSAIGPIVTYDSRDNQLNPQKGVYGTALAMFNIRDLGSDFSHEKVQVKASAYLPVNEGQVLAVHGAVCGVSTGGPFYDLCLYGQGNDLRGYEMGRYRDRASWATQVELRQHLFGKFGAVFFGGVGGIAPNIGDLGDSKILPAVGFGLRYRASKSAGINLRLDYAVGKDSNALYFSVGEAF